MFVLFIVYWVSAKYDSKTAKQVIDSLKPLWGIAAIFFTALGGILCALRWKSLINGFWKDAKVKTWDLYRFGLLGSFYMLFIPTSIAGEAVRIYKTSRLLDNNYFNVSVTIILDRIIGLALWLILFVLIQPHLKIWEAIIISLIAAVLVYRLFKNKINEYKNKFIDFVKYNPKYLFYAVIYSIASQFVYIMFNYTVFRCFGINIPLMDVSVIATIGVVASIVPVSVLGVGPREGAYFAILSRYGISSTNVILITAFMVAVGYMFSLLGGLVELIYDGFSLSKFKTETQEISKAEEIL